MKWNTIKVKDLGKVITGKTPPTKNPENFRGDYLFIKPPDLSESFRSVYSTETTISEIGLRTLSGKLLPSRTVCVVCIGTIGKKIGFTTRPSVTNQQINAVIPDKSKYSPEFVYYLLKYNLPKLKQIDAGSASGRENVNKTSFEGIEVNVPPLPTQKYIANILSAYDDLIENNRRRIQILEEMARNLYREWFVKFRFPIYRPDGTVEHIHDPETDPMVESELGLIPEGWVVDNIDKCFTIKKGKNITKKTIVEGTVPVVAGGIQPAYYHNTANTIGPVITISASGANSGFVNLYFENIWASDCSYIDSSMTEFIFFTNLLLINKQVEITHLQHGAAQPHVYPRDIVTVRSVHSPSELRRKFEKIITPLFKEIGVLKKKNVNLTQTRDLLLPRLISGKLDISSLIPPEKETVNVQS